MAFNTRGGEYGFLVELHDGTQLVESHVLWDDVPVDAHIAALRFVHLKTGVALANLTAFDRYFFMNEAIGVTTFGASGVGASGTYHEAKIFGGIKRDGTVVETRIVFPLGSLPKAQEPRMYSFVDNFPYAFEVLKGALNT